MRKDCVIVIPVYKPTPSGQELSSFIRCLKILVTHDICIVTYQDLDVSVWKNIASKHNRNINLVCFSRHFFSSVSGYNLLCLSKEFYQAFKSYEYMLIYQLDSWVFKNEIEFWCNKKYDYIGAPLFCTKGNQGPSKIIGGVGNGGFSLRRIDYCLGLLNRNKWLPLVKPSRLWHENYIEEVVLTTERCVFVSYLILFIRTIMKTFGYKNTLSYCLSSGKMNEDLFFGYWAPYYWGVKSNIPQETEAMFFSFDANPSFLFQKTHKLPFGCHAFNKWEYKTFWERFIKL